MRARALLLAGLLAGCLAPRAPGGPEPAPDSPFDLAMVAEHDHFDLSEHAAARAVRMLARDGLVAHGKPSGAHAVDLHGNTLVVARDAMAGESDPGFALFDVSDPRAPRAVGTFSDARAVGGDRQVMFSGDGATVFQAAESSAAGEFLILAVDVSDAGSPRLVAEAPVPPYGPHTLFAAEVAGAQYVYVISFGLQVWRYADGEFTVAGRYVAATPGQLLQTPDGPQAQRTYAFRDVYGHDVFAWEDPVTRQHLAFVAYAYDGFKILDLTDPRLPKELASWVPDGPDAPSYVHTVTVRMIGDRRIAAVGAETFENRNRDVPSPVWIVDVTDLARPRLLATWTNPAGTGSNDLLFSAHDMRFDEHEGRTWLWLTHYHGGVWALDVTDPAAPQTVGFYLPHEDQGYVPSEDCCSGLRMSGIPLTMDVVARDGVAYAADMWTGLYTLELVR